MEKNITTKHLNKMETNKIAELIEWIDTEPNLVKVQDGFLYHGQFFTNQQIIEMYVKRG